LVFFVFLVFLHTLGSPFFVPTRFLTLGCFFRDVSGNVPPLVAFFLQQAVLRLACFVVVGFLPHTSWSYLVEPESRLRVFWGWIFSFPTFVRFRVVFFFFDFLTVTPFIFSFWGE